ncbi:DUF3889 domain-containing protein [Tenuibacillus multivorans]|uniref:Rare lipoprotein A n=1 Tax=Tenuibacillus multivorans TaxID=237069 RepID=A0A1H0AWL6_9BACI|nr:DUF3889 domain-containing protein [Tenuibacillus multivorans]GEL77784.1 hypothetical protein TMU01_20190 [Tenuibacillus multivorans]SDN37857.1 rare lipoprotein A [Tenuibacillus multivorans]
MYYPYQYDPNRMFGPMPYQPFFDGRQQVIQGQATWTEGGQVTKCNIPWSDNQYMTVAVSPRSGFQCGQTLNVRNPQNTREVLVEVVDTVENYPPNRINLHRRAFEALGANPDVGVLDVEITPSPELEQLQFGKYLLEIVNVGYPGYRITDYQSLGTENVSSNRKRERYDFTLQSPRETITVRGSVVYNPNTNRVISFDLSEVEQ